MSSISTRTRDDVVRLVHREVDLLHLTQGLQQTLNKAVPFDGVCLLTVDPTTLLPTGEVVENGLPPAATARLTEIELGEPDVNKFTTLARARVPAARLSSATGGDLDLSLRQRELRRPHGFADELRAVLTGPTGSWGTLTLLRETKRPEFTDAEVRFMASLAPVLADGVRRVMLRSQTAAGDAQGPATGFMVVASDDTVELTNADAEYWLDELATSDVNRLPVAVRAVVAQTRQVAMTGTSMASARVQTRSGQWLIVRGSVVGDGRISVLLEAARPAELAIAIGDTYALTERERDITALVARGMTTNEIADRLHLSAYTIQDHLKAIFDKTGASTRGELVARLFLDHHLPHLSPTTDHHPQPPQPTRSWSRDRVNDSWPWLRLRVQSRGLGP
jgi:DNA-binding CsgD family transcriptional regulator/GAF domain-containing protein